MRSRTSATGIGTRGSGIGWQHALKPLPHARSVRPVSPSLQPLSCKQASASSSRARLPQLKCIRATGPGTCKQALHLRIEDAARMRMTRLSAHAACSSWSAALRKRRCQDFSAPLHARPCRARGEYKSPAERQIRTSLPFALSSAERGNLSPSPVSLLFADR